jgi:hypothetical protein
MITMNSVKYTGDRLDASLELGQQIADRWGTDPLMVQMSRDICKRWNTKNRLDESRAIREWITRRVKYVPDPAYAEMMADPVTTIRQGGDCDDQAILAAALLQAIGHDTRIGAVTWEGRGYASHCVAVDLTAACIVDPVADLPPETWPPPGFKVQAIRYRTKTGETKTMNGFFSKLTKALAKPFQKIFPAHTLLGKVMDPLGITDPSRNLNLAGRVSDVVGTAAAVVAGGWAIGAATAGTAGGFWATTAAGASAVGSGLGAAAGKVGLGLATAAATAAIMGGKQQAADPYASPAGYGAANYAPGGYLGPDYTGGGYAGGGSAGSAGYYDQNGNYVPPAAPATNILPIAAAGLIVLLLLTRK